MSGQSPGVTGDQSGILPPLQRLALNYAPPQARAVTGCLLALDARMAQLVGQSREALLAQMRLAWWREQLAMSPEARARGDAVLDEIGSCWRGEEASLVALVDGWEELLADPPLRAGAALSFAQGRAIAWGGAARLLGGETDFALRAARRWALVDLAARLSDTDERAMAFRLAAEEGTAPLRQSAALRPLAVLDGMAVRALRRGDPVMIEGRRAMLAVMRLGMFGR
ncbi:MAG: hypothetical protein IE933_15220 [Sphingomonadales bacterium]|nr:hypothetical protein [Sphingomonadales bacterium]MBD3772188.1 hypothetical protein [Paracoccaceae bacterium]